MYVVEIQYILDVQSEEPNLYTSFEPSQGDERPLYNLLPQGNARSTAAVSVCSICIILYEQM